MTTGAGRKSPPNQLPLVLALLGLSVFINYIDRGNLISVRALAEQHHVSLSALGNLDTLLDRIHNEVTASNTAVSFVPLVGVWARRLISVK